LVAACFALLVAAHPAAADTTPCPTLPSSPVFAPLGDSANYSAVPGGSFEGDMSGWSLTGASVAPGNEPWSVDGLGDANSLKLAPGATAVSPLVCVSANQPTWRFFAHAADSATTTQLHVYVQFSDKYGHTIRIPAAAPFKGGSYTSWEATPALLLGKYLPKGFSVQVQFVFSPAANGGAWSVDDVFVDPYAK
jgi:hypothetical protein